MLTFPFQQNPSGQPSWLAVSKKTPQNQKNPKPLCDFELENPGFVKFWVVMICHFYHLIIANQYTQHRSHRQPLHVEKTSLKQALGNSHKG